MKHSIHKPSIVVVLEETDMHEQSAVVYKVVTLKNYNTLFWSCIKYVR
jgi:hypothetical protein